MRQSFEVANVRCGGCAATIQKTLLEEGFTEIEVDLSCEPRKVTVDIDNEAHVAHLRAVLRRLGYPLADEQIGFFDSAGLKAKSVISCAVGKFAEADRKK